MSHNGTLKYTLSHIITYLTDKEVLLIKVSTEHLGRFTGDGFDLNADFLSFPGALHRFVVVFDTCHYTQFHELKEEGKKSRMF
jgi:hypothetical protein